MRFGKGLAAVALMVFATAANAEYSGNVSLVSDYMWRGITQTAGKPALQGGLDWAGDSGLYVGTWASNIDWGDCCDENVEVDIYAGFAGGDTVTWDIGYNFYWFPSADDAGDFGELYGSLGYEDWVTGTVWYAYDYADSGLEAFYFEGNGAVPLPADFSLDWHLGYSDGQFWGSDDYFDWSLGVSYSWRSLDFGLAYVDGSDLADLDDLCKGIDNSVEFPECKDKDVLSTDARVVLSVTANFPWSSE